MVTESWNYDSLPNFYQIPKSKNNIILSFSKNNIRQLKHNIMHTLGILMLLQRLIFGGKSMQEYLIIQDYNILPSCTIILNLRLRGGYPETRNSKGVVGASGSSIPKVT